MHRKTVDLAGKLILFFCTLALCLTSCVSQKDGEMPSVSRTIADKGIKTAGELYSFFMSQNPAADKSKVRRLAKLYVKEGAAEGINSDCAWVQMCLETGFLRYGNLVTPDMNNFCGLGAIDAEHPGERFETEALGVRAHIQHLHAYGTSAEVSLKNPLVDNRYKWVNPRGKAPTIFELSGTWASDREYGVKLDALLERLEKGSF